MAIVRDRFVIDPPELGRFPVTYITVNKIVFGVK